MFSKNATRECGKAPWLILPRSQHHVFYIPTYHPRLPNPFSRNQLWQSVVFCVSTASEELVSDWQSLPWCLAQEHPESSQIWQKPTWVCELCARGLIVISPRKSNLLLHRMTWQLTRNTRSSMVVVWQVVLSAFAISSSLCSFVWISTTFLPPPTSWLTSGLI